MYSLEFHCFIPLNLILTSFNSSGFLLSILLPLCVCAYCFVCSTFLSVSSNLSTLSDSLVTSLSRVTVWITAATLSYPRFYIFTELCLLSWISRDRSSLTWKQYTFHVGTAYISCGNNIHFIWEHIFVEVMREGEALYENLKGGHGGMGVLVKDVWPREEYVVPLG